MTDKALEAALKACPFCEGNAHLEPELHSDENPNEVIGTASVNCQNCGAAIWGDWSDDAIAAWNRRAPLSALPGEAEVVGRDIFECANQLGGYVGPNTDDGLARFLLRESNAAADLAHEIVRLRGALQAMQARAEKAERELSNMLQGVSDEES